MTDPLLETLSDEMLAEYIRQHHCLTVALNSGYVAETDLPALLEAQARHTLAQVGGWLKRYSSAAAFEGGNPSAAACFQVVARELERRLREAE